MERDAGPICSENVAELDREAGRFTPKNAIYGLFKLAYKGIASPVESGKLLTLKAEQQEHTEKWLHPVIDYVDLNRQGSDHNNNDVYVRFQIDSHLLNAIKDYYVFTKVCLSLPNGKENESSWYQIEEPENHEAIHPLARRDFSERKIRLLGETPNEKSLLEWMHDFRGGKPLLAMLKVGLMFKKEDKPNPILLEGSHWIAPMNDYRGA